MENIINSLEISAQLKQAYLHMAEVFEKHIPKSLYYDYYELETLTNIPAVEWENFLDIYEIDLYVKSKIAKLADFGARKALFRLAQNENLSTGDVTALKTIIENSKLLQQQQNQQQHIVLMRY